MQDYKSAQCLQSPEEGVGVTRDEVRHSCESPNLVLGTQLGTSQKHSELFTH